MFMTGVDLGPRKEQMEIENKKRECCVAFSSFFFSEKNGLRPRCFFRWQVYLCSIRIRDIRGDT